MLDTAAKLCRIRGLNLLGTFRKPIMIKPLCELLEAAASGNAGSSWRFPAVGDAGLRG